RTGRAALRYRPGQVWDRFVRRYEPSNCDVPLWLSTSGQRLLVLCTRPRPAKPGSDSVAVVPEFLVLDRGHAMALPWLAGFAPAMLALGGNTGYDGGAVATGAGPGGSQ